MVVAVTGQAEGTRSQAPGIVDLMDRWAREAKRFASETTPSYRPVLEVTNCRRTSPSAVALTVNRGIAQRSDREFAQRFPTAQPNV